MRVATIALLITLHACSSSSVVDASADARATTDVLVVDAPALDVPAVDVPTLDTPHVVDTPHVIDAPDVVDAPNVTDVGIDRPGTDVADVPVDHPLPDATAADVACASPMFRCGGVCVNLATDTRHCGSCGSVCPTGRPCLAGVCLADDCPGGRFCGGTCRQTSTDRDHCGGCGQQCCAGNACFNGTCSPGCPPGNIACPGPASSCLGGVCVNATVDPMNCGACGNRCGAGEVCVTGHCRGSGFMALAPCNVAGDYTMASTVRFGGATGNAYSPRCVTVRVGDTVTWEGDFSGHPRSPSTRGTSMNPITRAASGTSAAVRFTRAGFYPYFCEFHGDDAGSGMAGVVQVIE